ncbi:carboxypeptidase Y-deficient [Ascosphaera aggregata]|nr:carboxypeptidase Y-deficient [Ascosphaera aggregata]
MNLYEEFGAECVRHATNREKATITTPYSAFNAARKPIIDRAFLEVSRLEKRLSRLTNLLARLPVDHMQSGAVKRWTPWRDDERKKIEQSIVTWEDDANVERCPFCQQNFATYTFRRHHCRTCGRVVCGDPITKCSLEVGLTVALDSSQRNTATKPQASRRHVNVDVRLCRDCRNTLFERRDFEEECVAEPPDLRAYRNLRQFESGIKFLLPRFQRLLNALQDPDHPPLPEHCPPNPRPANTVTYTGKTPKSNTSPGHKFPPHAHAAAQVTTEVIEACNAAWRGE